MTKTVMTAAKKTKPAKTDRAMMPPVFILPVFGPALTADEESAISLSNAWFKWFLFLFKGFLVVVDDDVSLGGFVWTFVDGYLEDGLVEMLGDGLDVVVGSVE